MQRAKLSFQPRSRKMSAVARFTCFHLYIARPKPREWSHLQWPIFLSQLTWQSKSFPIGMPRGPMDRPLFRVPQWFLHQDSECQVLWPLVGTSDSWASICHVPAGQGEWTGSLVTIPVTKGLLSPLSCQSFGRLFSDYSQIIVV